MARTLPESIVIGIVRRPHGVRGEVKVRPLTDFPERFRDLKSVVIEFQDGGSRRFTIEKVRTQYQDLILKFNGINSRDEAATLSGGEIMIPVAEARELPDDRFYHFEVIGFEVATIFGHRIGTVKEVMDLPANAVFVVIEQENEFLIPCIKDVIRNIDRKEHRIVIDPIEGLLD